MLARHTILRFQEFNNLATAASFAVLTFAMRYLDQPWKYYQLMLKILNS